LWTHWGIGDAALDREIHESEDNLARILGTLREAGDTRPEVAEQLQAAQSQMGFMLDAAKELRVPGANARALEYLAKAGDYLLEAADRLVALYEAPGS
jgi:DNA uptake protein ComE-like DNA-binding protein